jgi:hypothetical protein
VIYSILAATDIISEVKVRFRDKTMDLIKLVLGEICFVLS